MIEKRNGSVVLMHPARLNEIIIDYRYIQGYLANDRKKNNDCVNS